jgi:DNA-directed RNA polymerase subunit M/transcription elongation factor TFIIS
MSSRVELSSATQAVLTNPERLRQCVALLFDAAHKSSKVDELEETYRVFSTIEAFQDVDYLYNTLGLLWNALVCPEANAVEHFLSWLQAQSGSSRETMWSHAAFDASRAFEKREIEAMKPIKPLVEGIYQCPKCHSRSTSVVKAQTRSADEGMTDFITCHNCGKKWKINN